MQWLRVATSGSYDSRVVTTSIRRDDYSRHGEYTDKVTTMGMSQFLTYVAFGSTCHIEPAVTPNSSLNGFTDMSSNQGMDEVMTQALLRSYESRLDVLLAIAGRQRRSMIRNEEASKALIAEMCGCCILWRQLMDVGRISPMECVQMDDMLARVSSVPEACDKVGMMMASLQIRLHAGDFSERLPLVLDQSERERLLRSYGVGDDL